jgi:hypothetical protein
VRSIFSARWLMKERTNASRGLDTSSPQPPLINTRQPVLFAHFVRLRTQPISRGGPYANPLAPGSPSPATSLQSSLPPPFVYPRFFTSCPKHLSSRICTHCSNRTPHHGSHPNKELSIGDVGPCNPLTVRSGGRAPWRA